MKKIQLFLAFIFMATTVFCQNLHELPDWLVESCEGGKPYNLPIGRHRLDRFINETGSNPKGQFWTRQNSYTSLEAIHNLKLPEFSKATHRQSGEITVAHHNNDENGSPKNYISWYIAQPAAGVFVKDKAGNSILLPFYILNDPNHAKYKDYNDLRKNSTLLHIRPHNNSGAKQIFYHVSEQNIANFRRDNPRLVNSSDDDIRKRIIDENIQTKGAPIPVPSQRTATQYNRPPTPANDNNRPPSPSNDNNRTPPTRPAPPAFKIKENIDKQHMEEIKQNYNKLPGGVLMQPTAQLPASVYKIAWDSEKLAFIINDLYVYETNLLEDEVAELYRLARSKDQRLGAISQDEFINVKPASPIAQSLSAADIALGKILYGFDMQGNRTPKNVIDGYENPEEKDHKTLKWCFFNWNKTAEIAQKQINSLEQRVFIEFKGFNFGMKDNAMSSTNADIQVSYQTFTTDYFSGKQVFSEKTPDKMKPEFAKAVSFFRNNYSAFENQYPELAKARAIAEVFSFCKAIREKGLTIENQSFATIPVLEIPTTYEFYNNYEANSEQGKEAATVLSRLSWFPTWFLSKDSKFKMYYLRFNYACQAHDYKKIAEYRIKLLDLLNKMDKSSSFFAKKQQLIAMVKTADAMGIYAKINFGQKYLAENRYTAEANLYQALKYFELMVKIEPINANNFQELATIYALLGQDDKAKSSFQQYFTLLEQDAKTDVAAMNRLAVFLYYGNKEYTIEINKERAIKLLEKAVTQNHPIACCNLANIYIEQNPNEIAKAKELLQKSLQLGYANAAHLLGIFAYNNDKDYPTALEYFKQSAQEGNAESKYILGLMYLKGDGVTVDKDTAYFYIKQSAELGYDKAIEVVKVLKTTNYS